MLLAWVGWRAHWGQLYWFHEPRLVSVNDRSVDNWCTVFLSRILGARKSFDTRKYAYYRVLEYLRLR